VTNSGALAGNEKTALSGVEKDEVLAEVEELPSARQAERTLGEVAWDDRLTGEMYNSGPGASPEDIFRIRHVRNLLLASADMFRLDWRQLQRWVGHVLGEEAMAAEIGALVDAVAEADVNEICDRVWIETDTERRAQARIVANAQIASLAEARTHLREDIIMVLGKRIAQCEAVLEMAECSSS